MIAFYKGIPSWKRTVYVMGLPRSGKSTVLNIIGSCADVESVDEPLELQMVAQKGAQYDCGTAIFEEYLDTYMAGMDNCYMDLVLGRRYNYRACDRSSIYHFKSRADIKRARRLLRRSDAMAVARQCEAVFAIAHNDLESAIPLITMTVPAPHLVSVHRPIHEVAACFTEKMWFSDEQLENQANICPAFSGVVEKDGRRFFIPQLIPDELGEMFLSLSLYDRSYMYCRIQDHVFNENLARNDAPRTIVKFEDLMGSPQDRAQELLDSLKLTPTLKTRAVIASISTPEAQSKDKPRRASHELWRCLEQLGIHEKD